MSYMYEQKIRGHIYVYKVTSYWDKEKKQSRQKRVYLGKKDSSTGKIVHSTRKVSMPLGSRNIGSIHLLKEISQKLKLLQVLKKVFPRDYEKILYLSFFKVIQREPYYLYHLWCDEFYVSDENNLNSQEISDFLSMIGQSEFDVEVFLNHGVCNTKISLRQ